MQGLGHRFITSGSSHFFNKTELKFFAKRQNKVGTFFLDLTYSCYLFNVVSSRHCTITTRNMIIFLRNLRAILGSSLDLDFPTNQNENYWVT